MSAFEIYAIASVIRKKEDAIQRATMLHGLGPAEKHIFNTLPGEHKSLEEVKTALMQWILCTKTERCGRALQV